MTDKVTAISAPAERLQDGVDQIILLQRIQVAAGSVALLGAQNFVLMRITLLSGRVVVLPMPSDAALMLSAELTRMVSEVEAATLPADRKGH